MKIIFWTSVLLIFYIYFGYPSIIYLVSFFLRKTIKRNYAYPTVSIIISAFNEEDHIKRKIMNLLNLDYPREKIEILIGSDGSTDKTETIVSEYVSDTFILYRGGKRDGKPKMLNILVSMAKGEVLLFTDARQELDKNSVRKLVSNFSDSSVGCVSGELIFRGEDENSVAKSVGFYWRYEKWMRSTESRIHSMIGATGAIYAIRKGLFVAPPEDTILDDVFIPLKVVEEGFRSIFDSEARAYDNVAYTSGEEFRRKVRTLAGNFQLFMQCRNLFNPLRSKIAWQFFSHKFLRAIAFFFLILLFISNFFLIEIYPYNFIFILQVIFYTLALAGFALENLRIKGKILAFPYVFCVLNLAALEGFFKFSLGKQKVTWEKAR